MSIALVFVFVFTQTYTPDQNYRTPLRAARESEAPGAERIIEMLLRSGAREGRLPSFVKVVNRTKQI